MVSKRNSITADDEFLVTQFLFLSGDENAHQSTNISVNANGFSSDVDARQKSKKETGLSLDQQQLAELENQLVMKIMKHFKTNYNYSPGSGANVDDVFYSPIGEMFSLLCINLKVHYFILILIIFIIHKSHNCKNIKSSTSFQELLKALQAR